MHKAATRQPENQPRNLLVELHAIPDDEEGNSLEDVVRDEEEVPRQRLRDQLGREPSEEEVKEWLRQHTEGY